MINMMIMIMMIDKGVKVTIIIKDKTNQDKNINQYKNLMDMDRVK